jgi:hypothetical protein
MAGSIDLPTSPATEKQGESNYPCGAAAFLSNSCCVRKMLHQSLCSATGIPHSTQTRTR